MAVATADAQGRPSVRHVLLRGADERGFVFYTNYESRKGRQLTENPWAGLVFLWKELDRQVHVTGPVERVDPRRVRRLLRHQTARRAAGCVGLASERAARRPRGARGPARGHGPALPRRRAPAAQLGRLPGEARGDRVLAGAPPPVARSLPVHRRTGRLADRTALALAASRPELGARLARHGDHDPARARRRRHAPDDRRPGAARPHPLDRLPGLRPGERSRQRRGHRRDPSRRRRARGSPDRAHERRAPGTPPSSGRSPAPTARPPCCCTPTTTCSPRATPPSGTARRSNRRSATAVCTGAAPPTTRPASRSTPRRCALWASMRARRSRSP